MKHIASIVAKAEVAATLLLKEYVIHYSISFTLRAEKVVLGLRPV